VKKLEIFIDLKNICDMVLSDRMITRKLSEGAIVIEPFDKKYLNPVSVDLTLAPTFKVYKEGVLDPRIQNETETFTITDEGFVLEPGEVYLYACNERIGVKGNIRAKVEGKSSLGRLGLFVHVTAGFIDPGFEGSLVLELVATRRVKVYPNMKICQVEFAFVEGEIGESYDKKEGSKYHNQEGVQESLYYKNYK
jgi:dCTP deaminase